MTLARLGFDRELKSAGTPRRPPFTGFAPRLAPWVLYIRLPIETDARAGERLARLLVCYHPSRSPWLMPLEPIFGWVKCHVLGGRVFETIAELTDAVVECFQQRVGAAKERRDQMFGRTLTLPLQKSGSVL